MVLNHSKMGLLIAFDSLLLILLRDLDQVGPFLGLQGRPDHGPHAGEVQGLVVPVHIICSVTWAQIVVNTLGLMCLSLFLL